jgi:hypothetical protein
MKEDVPAANRRQDETRRIGHEAATRESVKDAVANKTVHGKAKFARFAATGEPSQAPCYEDVK